MAATAPAYEFFEVAGIELEYPIVDAALRARNLVEPLFRRLTGRPASEAESGDAVFSNELAAHVFEIKTARPQRSLRRAERQLIAGLRAASRVLKQDFDARLLPTGMHPFLRPAQAQLWPRSGRPIYEAYAKLFPVRGHGWMNVQSCHINLPFGSEHETVLLHNAIAALLPYLPALAASSPIYGGRPGPYVCNRLAFYRGNQRRIPAITGGVVPEFMASYAQYKRDILQPIYRELERLPGGRRLQHEWVNSRGAIVRFSRRAIEIRVLDTQECPQMDIAIAAFTRAALKSMVSALDKGTLALPPRAVLLGDFDQVIRAGSHAAVDAQHLRSWLGLDRRPPAARRVLLALLKECATRFGPDERGYAPLVEQRLRTGNLSETIRREVERRSPRCGSPAQAIREVYEELAGCLDDNRPWKL